MRGYLLLIALSLAILLSTVVANASSYALFKINVPFYLMHEAICAIKSLQMTLSYYGFNYSESLLP